MAGIPIIRRPMKPAKKGEAPTYDWARWVETTLRRLVDVPPPRNRPINGGESEKPPFWGTLSQVPDSDPAEYQVSFTLGYLTYQNAGASEAEQGVTGYIVPTINGVAMDSDEVEPLELPAVVSYVYLRVKTTADGVPKFDGASVTIEAFEEPQESIHHVRQSPSGGEEEGDYYFLLMETEEIPDSDPAAPRVKRRLTGNRYLPNQLIEIENVGEGELDDENAYEIYKGYQVGPDDKHQLRTLKQIAIPENTEAARLLVPKEDGDDPGDSIKVKIIKKGNSASTPYTIQDEEESATIRLQGLTGAYIDAFGGQVNFLDGLATDTQGGAFEGWWGQIGFQFQPAGSSSLQTLTIDVSNGIITNVDCSQGSAGSGTQNDPEFVVFQFGDT